jgi:hypothetical protein|tara:strand:- start:455 stop:703 length:249 start_codon:yes stop_codon:yes gene_type:complete
MKSGRLPKVMKKSGFFMSKNDITGDNIRSKISGDNSKYADGWSMIFDKPKARKRTPAHAVTRVEKDKTKQIPRNNKYKYIEE